jgi:hypothetical protein
MLHLKLKRFPNILNQYNLTSFLWPELSFFVIHEKRTCETNYGVDASCFMDSITLLGLLGNIACDNFVLSPLLNLVGRTQKACRYIWEL